MLLHRDVEVSCATILLLKLLHCRPFFLCGPIEDCLGYESWSVDIVTLFGLCNVEPVEDGLLLFGVFGFLRESMVKQDVASFAFNVGDAVSRDVRHLDQVGICLPSKGLDLFTLLSRQFGEFLQV